MKKLIYFSLLTFFISCNTNTSNENTLNESYQGFWAETAFSYEFYRNGEFEFKTRGHYGDIDLKGNYSINNDTISLLFKNEQLKFDGIIGTKYLLEEDKKCIEELKTQISYCLDAETTIQRATEDKIMATVSKIDKVIERSLYVQSNSKGERNLEFMIRSRPSENKYKKYWVKVVEDNGVNLVPHCNFLVEDENKPIYFLDTTTDSLIELEEWQNPNGINE